MKDLNYSQTKELIRMNQDELTRLYRKIYNRIASFGGTCYGLDWHTIGITHPKLKTYLWTIQRLHNRQNGRFIRHGLLPDSPLRFPLT